MNEELDSQLSAMFDDELPSAECELLARRLSRDEQLKARWGRYAVVGAVIRAERGVRLHASLAGRVSAVLSAEPALATQSLPPAHRAAPRWWQPLAATALAASVAALCVLWLRGQAPQAAGPLSVQVNSPYQGRVAIPATAAVAPDSYIVPPKSAQMMVVPSSELANYVVAHSMFSPPVARGNLLSAFMTNEPGASMEVAEGNAKTTAH
jgi:negative regulator of sigma E activity